MNRLISLILFLFAVMAIGCSSDDGSATCDRVTLEETDYCVYEGAITETGYDCPPDMPNLYRDEGVDIAVCSGENERPPFEEIEAARAANGTNVGNNSSTSNGGGSDHDDPPIDAGGGELGACPDPEMRNFDGCVVDLGTCPDGNTDAIDLCDGLDNDCDGEVDEPVECDDSLGCPEESGLIPRCESGFCVYRPPNQLGECSDVTLACVDGEREEAPAECQ